MTRSRLPWVAAGLVVLGGLGWGTRAVQARGTDPDARLANAVGMDVSAMRDVRRIGRDLAQGSPVSDADWLRLVELTKSPHGMTRLEAYETLGSAAFTARGAEALQHVRGMKNDPDPAVRASYVFALIRLQAPDWRTEADRALASGDPLVVDVTKDAVSRAEGVEQRLRGKKARWDANAASR